MHKRPELESTAGVRWVLAPCAAAILSACGGGGLNVDPGAVAASRVGSTSSITLAMDAVMLPADAAGLLAQPTFHLAPVVLDAPDDADAVHNAASARTQPRVQAIPAGLDGLQTRGLTVQALQQAQRLHALSAPRLGADGQLAPSASSSAVSTYTPAQIRAAYGLPPLPGAGVAPTAAQAAQMGAGQTIYIVDAMHDPNVAAELSAFNQKFGLPVCTTKSIAAGSALPLAAANPGDGCVLSVVYSTPGAATTATAPAYDAGWATEIALDVQWAHATAPLARIVLIESADASLNGLLGAVKLANAMGSGVVSMSFGATEGNWTASVDPAFAGSGMTYLAATGDWGTQVSWPAVAPNVLAVGGTSLKYSGSGARSEASWSRTGGGVSLYTPTPAYQANTVPGVGSLPHRAVADVAFNADPATGQFVAVIPQGTSAVNWVSAGGTSLSTPQWAGLIAVANAVRSQGGKQALGAPHAALYGQIAAVPGTYAAAFADILTGSNGACATCYAKVGYDQLTGLGTPNVTALLAALFGSAGVATAPVVNAAAIGGKSGIALSFNVSVTASNPVTYALVNAPSGMTIGTTGAVSWPKPLTGTYAVTVTAKDTRTGLSGQGVYTLKIDAPAVAPVVTAATVNGKAGTSLTFSVAVSASSATGFSLSNAPAGMSVSGTGVVSWANPVAGTYSVTVTAANSGSGLSGKGVITVIIAKAQPPVITAAALAGIVGKALTGSIAFSDPGGYALAVTITGVPMGMTFTASGQTLVIKWSSPVLGKYSLNVTAKDSAGLVTQATVPISIAAK